MEASLAQQRTLQFIFSFPRSFLELHTSCTSVQVEAFCFLTFGVFLGVIVGEAS